jgi:hypothetical protein
MKKEKILLRLEQLEDQVFLISERLYNPSIETSEFKKLTKRKNKLKKDIEKLKKKAVYGNE